MASRSATPGQRFLQVLLTVVTVVAALYFGQEVLMPLAMAVLLSFLLTPVVAWLEKHGLPRVPAVILVMAVIFTSLSVGGWLVATELARLGDNLEEYKDNLKGRARGLLPAKKGGLDELSKLPDEVLKEMEKEADEDSPQPAGEDFSGVKPTEPSAGTASTTSKDKGRSKSTLRVLEELDKTAVNRSAASAHEETESAVYPVRIVSDTTAFDTISAYVGTFVTPLANLAIITVLVIFMLIQREDLRNRLVRLAGKKLTLTTRTLDEVGTRISRYLLMLSLVNGSFGVAVAIGLLLIGVPYALLWGSIAAVLRFVPYVGPMLSATLPIAMSLVHFPANDWWNPGLTLGLIVVLELISNNVIEPLAYGRSTGVSVVALLVAATFWTWVWGPVGLMLSVPLTVVLAVLGEHVPALEPLGVLLGDKPALATHMSYYQRLLAGDFDEAATLVDEHIKAHCLRDTYDDVLVPALVSVERDRASDDLTVEEQSYIWQSTRDLIEDAAPDNCPDLASPGRPQDNPRAYILGCSAHDTADELALRMLGQLLESSVGEFEVLGAGILASEVVSRIEARMPDAVCISSLGPVGGRQARYLCKRIRMAAPNLRIIVGRWGFRGDLERMTRDLRERGADQVVVTLDHARDLLQRVTPLPAIDGTAKGTANAKAAIVPNISQPTSKKL